MKAWIYTLFLVLSTTWMFGMPKENVIPGKVVIKIKPEYFRESIRSSGTTGIASLDAKLNRLGIRSVSPRFSLNEAKSKGQSIRRILLVEFDPALSPVGIANSLGLDPSVEYAEPLYPDEMLDVPNDPKYATSLNFASMQAEAAWSIHKGELGSQPVILAVTDSGVNWTHPDLAPNVWQNLAEDHNANGYTLYYTGSAWVMDSGDINGIDDDGNGKVDDLIGWDFMLNANGDEANNPSDMGSHGTIVSGLAAARTNNATGVSSLSWNVTLMPISCSYPGAGSSLYKTYDAVVYAAENGADVINCSWGSNTYSSAGKDAIDYARSLGSIIVAAAGNANNQTLFYPAAYPGVVATASLLNSGVKWSGSSYGNYVDVGAPNETVDSTYYNSYITISGATSYASPIASALIALVKSYHPTWTADQIITQVKGTCDDIDLLNVGKENLLGEGKLNAYRALTEISPTVDQEIHLALFSQGIPTDTNLNNAIEPGETFSVNLRLRNHSYGVSSPLGTFVLSTTSPYVTINVNTYTTPIPADDYFDLSNAFSVTVLPGTASQYITFTLSSSADKPIVTGSSLSFQILVQNGGYFVWEPVNNARDLSGNYIRNALQNAHYNVTYGTTFPPSFYSFAGVFLSFGQVGSSIERFASPLMYNAVKEYLLSGGKIYIEGGDVVGFDMGYYLPDIDGGLDANEVLWPLLGIAAGNDGSTNVIDALSGVSGLLTEGMSFSSSTQTKNDFIDTFTPLAPYAMTAFSESGYGNVGIVNIGDLGQRSFVMSYTLRELVDGTGVSTRTELINRLISFFSGIGLDAPAQLTITANPGSPGQEIHLDWQAVLGAPEYRVYGADAPEGPWSVAGTVSQSEADLPGTPGKKFYKITAINE